ncbi:MAG: response regulator transcription factor [Noviherbaspirillum sp.]
MQTAQKSLTVVIADDDNTTCRVLRLLLREHGHQVVGEAHDGEKAVELCETYKPDIAFLDIEMPRLNGHEAAKKIRESNPDIGVIIVSAMSTLSNVRSAVQAGVNGFVVKPFNAVKVVEAIDNCVKQKRQ